MSRAGGFTTTLRPFGGSTINLDALYNIGVLPAPAAPSQTPPPVNSAPPGQVVSQPGSAPAYGTGQIPVVPDISAALDARAAAIPQLQTYIANLTGVANPTASQRQQLAIYQARLAEYQAGVQQAAAAPALYNPVIPPAPPPSAATAAALAARQAAIPTIQGYIANLSAVANPTTAQRAALATYRARLAEYQGGA
jgi:hypothetical protein